MLHFLTKFLLICSTISLSACVDPFDQTLRGTVDIVVVDGTITNLAEPQLIRLNRSRADPVTGRFGTIPITKANVEVVIDSTQIIAAPETIDGTYRLPGNFRGQVGHAYQLRFTLSDGSRYESTQQIMPALVAIGRVYQRFNPASLPAQRSDGRPSLIRGASDVYVDWQDPATERNYYRWEWTLWEKQDWCRSCGFSYYLIWNPGNTNQLYEDCYTPPNTGGSTLGASQAYFVNDYPCRTRCWEILYSYELNLFNDELSNGGRLTGRRVAQIPYYQDTGCLVEVRQSSLTQKAHAYFELLQQQTQNTGGLADSPPAIPIGNVRNVADGRETTVGFFTASAVAAERYWLDRRDATGQPPGLFRGMTGLYPSAENLLVDPNDDRGKPSPPASIGVRNFQVRPPTAVCVSSDRRTPVKPEGWRD
ncbi:DUF4249 domain-containing protein [Spirosoma utsteinense]|uniref:DUF4249 domain-containing protein n=1 Tax=Spirosoma utsteinense TaxID=2585773 RepID=A0ABR6WE69_9BACT|nr:DUF4249 domain-containing protein [Spirosoma utsteinense]MBC3788912.1 hypothetical protein [Spirosoma utsteinense]MBC3794829.1 hypothetical protein [Spirosoma utsteinense]